MADLTAVVQRKQGFLFLPLVYRLAARLEQMDWEELAEDPASASHALRGAQRLFKLTALVSHFRIGVEAEACGADLARDHEGVPAEPLALGDPTLLGAEALDRAPLAHVLDVTRRLSDELRNQSSVVAVLTGPRTLSGFFGGPLNGLGPFYATLTKAYAERGAKLLLVAEAPGSAGRVDAQAALAPLFNVAGYFRLPVVLLDAADAEASSGFGLVLKGDHLLPIAQLEASPEAVAAAEWRQRAQPLLCTEWEVPPTVPAEHLLAWNEALGQAVQA